MRWATILGSAIFLAACASQPTVEDGVVEEPPTPEEQFEQAEANRANGKLGEAVTLYAPLTEGEGELALQSKLAIAAITLEEGHNREALQAYKLILKEAPGNIEALEGRGLALLAQGDWQGAREQLMSVNGNEPGRWRTLNGLGVVADMSADYTAAAQWYGRALQAGGERALVINNAGYSLIMAREYQAAEKLLERGVVRFPSEQRLNHNLAIAQARQGHYNRAIRTWQKTMDRPDALNNAGYVAKINGDKEKAKSLFTEAMETSTRYRPRIDANLKSLDK